MARWDTGLRLVCMSKFSAATKNSTVQKASLSSKVNGHNRVSEESLAQRDLFVDILSANATRRDAKQFLARLKEHKATDGKDVKRRRSAGPTVNLGSLYTSANAIANAPQFIRDHATGIDTTISNERHVALISLREAHKLDDATINGLATTIAQLVKLDMHILFVLNHEAETRAHNMSATRSIVTEQALRLVRAIDEHCPNGARLVMDALIASSIAHDGLEFISPKLLLDPLSQGMVTIVPTLAYSSDWKMEQATFANVMLALVGIIQQHSIATPAMRLDRIILLDPLGGIPSRVRDDNAHVFINLEQEFLEIEAELDTMRAKIHDIDIHLENLRVLDSALAILPPSTSALIVSPREAAAASSAKHHDASQTIRAGTRKHRNTLIHNLLTNKPLVSSSLPTARLPSAQAADKQSLQSRPPSATLVKKGMPLVIIPSVEHSVPGWQRFSSVRASLDLENDPRIDFPRLVHLINDSFRRELDVPRYLDRINGRVAGLIIAGNYEGGAILTWEDPADVALSDPSRLVPYLDKFAVLQSSQGSAGVADIVFQAMVRSCFPQGVCWRSRSNNPVNKWYFERAAGSWTLPNSQWTMFWTGAGIVDDRQRWRDYVAVCEGIVPTWADGKAPD